jgi:hypothetical protein
MVPTRYTAFGRLFIISVILAFAGCSGGASSKPQNIEGHYANTSDSNLYIELWDDGKWLAQGGSGGQLIQQTGQYHQMDGRVVFDLMGAATTATISGTTLVVPQQDSWVVPPGTFTKQ